MRPRLNEGAYVFISVSADADTSSLRPIATMIEDEGLSLVVEESKIDAAEFQILFRAAWITLTVNSDLNAVGLTAAIASALASEGISCNVVAGAQHDHLFVPIDSAQDVMAVLAKLQGRADSRFN